MPGLQGEHVASLGSPIKRSKLSLRFFQKKETKRVLDFSQPQTEDANCDQVVPAPPPRPSSPDDPPLSWEKRGDLLPFVGFSNSGNTCYLNSILQVLYYCPGLKEGIKSLCKLSKRTAKPTEETKQCEEPTGDTAKSLLAQVELLENFHGLIRSVEQLQSNFLIADSFSGRELDTSPRKVLNTLRRLNPMYEGYLQHDAQEVLQYILGYIQEACNSIRKEQKQEDNVTEDIQVEHISSSVSESQRGADEDGQVTGKRKSDTEIGNTKKKPKSGKCAQEEHLLSAPVTRSKIKLSRDKTVDNSEDKAGEMEEPKESEQKEEEEEEGSSSDEKTFKEADGKNKKSSKLGWIRPAGKQLSIMSMFRTVGKLTSTFAKSSIKREQETDGADEGQTEDEKKCEGLTIPNAPLHQDCLDLMERLFHGQLVLRTRCLECESFTERQEDFQDISVPVLEEQPASPDDLISVSPYPKPEEKTLKWAIAQFASVERIAGEDKYFCDTCHHYAEAERSLLFDKTPEVVTIHLKRFSASSLEMDPYSGLSKVNTPLQTPLTLSLDEWCTPCSSSKGHHYELFAVVMHSGVSISSGHYTAYVRMSGLKDAKFWLSEREQLQESQEETRDCNDGELHESSACGKPGSKKCPGGGLLGGQRSQTGVEHDERAGVEHDERAADEQRKTLKRNAEAEFKKEAEPQGEHGAISREEEAASEQQALNNLLQYEGKWLLFDDSEVHLFKEEDFLRACSSQTCSSSTPYLLFYKRIHKMVH
ncbi:ubiquitin carboxyl-terminal hydrolase 1 isoform X2 [Vanacampus margaritifer]